MSSRCRRIAKCVLVTVALSLGLHLGVAPGVLVADDNSNGGVDPPLPPGGGGAAHLTGPTEALIDWAVRLIPRATRLAMI